MNRHRYWLSLVAVMLGGLGGVAAAPAFAVPPANDTCANATVVNGNGFTDTVLNLSTAGDDFIANSCSTNTNFVHNGIWYKYTVPPGNRTVIDIDYRIIMAYTNPDEPYVFGIGHTISVYKGTSCGNLAPFTTLINSDGNDYSGVYCVSTNLIADSYSFHSKIRVTPGETYYFLLGTQTATAVLPSDAYAIVSVNTVGLPPPPSNDTCSTATVIASLTNLFTDSKLLAGAFDDFPLLSCEPSDKQSLNGVWYAYTPQVAHERINFQYLNGSGYDAGIFTGTCGGSLTQIACLNNLYFPGQTFELPNANTTYYFLLVYPGNANASPLFNSSAQYNVNITSLGVAVPPPPNDQCANATVINSLPFTSESVAIGGADDNDGWTNFYNGVWYKYTPTHTQFITAINTITADGLYDPNVGAYRIYVGSSCGSLVQHLYNARLDAGVTYYFLAASAVNDTTGSPKLPGNAVSIFSLADAGPPPPPPANDLCQNAVVISSLPFTMESINPAASGTVDSTDSLCGNPGRWSVWYRWTAPQDISYVYVSGTGLSTSMPSMDVYEGTNCSSLIPIRCPSDESWMDVTPGSTYYFRVHGEGFQLNATAGFFISPASLATNDFCANAFDIASMPEGTIINIQGTTFSTEDPPICPTCNIAELLSYPLNTYTCDAQFVFYQSIYFTFTPPASGTLAVNSTLSQVLVSTGECGSLQPVQCVGSITPVHLDAGVRYTIILGDIGLTESDNLGWGNKNILEPNFHFVLDVPPCPGDFNGDHVRDVADLFGYINAWLAKTSNADFNHDTFIDVADLFGYINAWLAGC